MARLGFVDVPGKSGALYKFAAYAIDTRFRAQRAAVYIVTRRRQVAKTGGFKHRRLAVDQTDDLRQLLAAQPGLGTSRAANCICIHPETDRTVRRAIQNDLRAH